MFFCGSPLIAQELYKKEPNFKHAVWLITDHPVSKPILLGCAYRYPGSTPDENIQLNKMTKMTLNHTRRNVALMGNLNYSEIRLGKGRVDVVIVINQICFFKQSRTVFHHLSSLGIKSSLSTAAKKVDNLNGAEAIIPL